MTFWPLRSISWILLIALAVSSGAQAQTGYFEREPNDTPDRANPITGPIVVFGSMPSGDQDGFVLTVSDNDARKLWNFELTGIPGALTIADLLRVEYADNGIDVVNVEPLMQMGTRDGLTPSVHRNQLLEPGEYIVGIAHTGGPDTLENTQFFRPPIGNVTFGEDPDSSVATSEPQIPANASTSVSRAYRFEIAEGAVLNVAQNVSEHQTQANALEIRPGNDFAVFDSNDSAWYSLTFDEAAAAQRWQFEIRSPIGRQLTARLIDSSGAELERRSADAHGQILFADLAPQVSTWFLELMTPEPGFIHAVQTRAVGARIEGEEAEPNGQFALANRADLARPVTGRIGPEDITDYFQFRVSEAMADQMQTLRLETETEVNATLCLLTADGAEAQCRTGMTPIELPDLLLAAGDWGFSVGRAPMQSSYTVTLQAQGAVEAGTEAEPNDLLAFAAGMPENFRIRGRFSGDDADFYALQVADEAQLWRFQVVGDEVIEVAYYDGDGRQKANLRPPAGQRRVRLDDVFLLPGRHYVRVQGRDGGEYTLLARAVGPPNPDGEIEPNDDSNRQRLAFGQTRIGLLADPTDVDHYRFFLGNHDHIRLTLAPPADGMLDMDVLWYDASLADGQPVAAGEPIVLEGVFPPGDYHVVLSPREVSEAEYTLALERLPRFSCSTDCEPNGMWEIYRAAPLPADLVLEGRTGEWSDQDVYALPRFDRPTEIVIRSAEQLSLGIGLHVRALEMLQYDADLGGYQATVPPDDDYRLIVDATGRAYRLELEVLDGTLQPRDRSLEAELTLALDAEAVAAYQSFGQAVTGEIVIENSGAAGFEARLEAVTSDARWNATLADPVLSVPAGGRAAVGINVEVPSDAWADRPVRISVRALDVQGRQAEAWQEIAVDRDAAPVAPALYWPIPQSLRGGFNAAWLQLGGELTVDRTESPTTDFINDGLTFPGQFFLCCTDADGWSEDEKPRWTVDLPGDEPLPVAGVALNHFGPDAIYQSIRAGALLLSEDGVSFVEVLQFETLPLKTEQHFALPAPIAARYAQLRIDGTFQERSNQRVAAAEWKVILEPGFDLSAGAGFNLADPVLGGHVVWDAPPEAISPTGILVDAEQATSAGAALRAAAKQYVIGFQQNRAAQITRVDWEYPETFGPELMTYDRVTVSAALESSVGPWLPLGEIDLGDEQRSASLTLPTPAWARFVRLTAYKSPGTNNPMEPGVVRIWERPSDASYFSVLTEWGDRGSSAFYELQSGLRPEPQFTAADNLTRDTAAPLMPGVLAGGEVSLREPIDHWYRFNVPAGNNTLSIELTGDPTVRAAISAENAAGDAIALRRIDAERLPHRFVYEAVAEPGSDVWLKIAEPPRNVVFSWDTSASVAPYIPLINNALVAFSSQVVRGREAVNLIPFDQQPLLREWYGEPYALQTMLNEYRLGLGSSSAETTLKTAAQALAPLPGTKAVVVVTDAETPHDGEMWTHMQRVRPQIFSVGVGGSTIDEYHRLRDWASINGGHYTRLTYDGETEVAFDRAVTLMRRPAGYTLKVDSEFRELPGPGRLSVVPEAGGASGASGANAAGTAVELILDASGSMLQRMEGERRIDIAKGVLTGAVRELIPAGTPVALRVFGHREPDACRTDLEIPLGPLDAEAAAATIDGIQAMNLARTPIADSLAAAEADLGGAPDGAVVVLVTDGEETCDGNPEAVIASLRDRGIEVSLNIVGFAIDDAELAAQFEAWAELGGGRYFAANDPDDLSDALEVALRVSYTVYDQGGNEVAIGEVGGEPVELDQGVYRVVVGTADPQIFEAVEVPGDREVELRIQP